MSYLIHNFHRYHYSVRMTWRLKTLFLARNFTQIYALLSSSTKAFNLLSISIPCIRSLSKVDNWSFKKLIRVALPRVKEIRHTPIGVNFPRSAHYESLLQMDRITNTSHPIKTFLPSSPRLITYPYLFGSPLVFTPVAKSPLLEMLYRFLRMSLSMWFFWPGKYKITSHYTNLPSQLRFLPFLNLYYLKVYNI